MGCCCGDNSAGTPTDATVEGSGRRAFRCRRWDGSAARIPPMMMMPAGAGECASFVSEHVALQKVLRDDSAVDDNERPAGALTVMMNRLGDHSFARSAFALNQHRPATPCGLPDRVREMCSRCTSADQVFQPDRCVFNAAGQRTRTCALFGFCV